MTEEPTLRLTRPETGDEAPPGGPAPAPARVLVVDDNAISRKKMRFAVESLGHRCAVAEDGARALEALRAEPFDAVLLDILMPEIDGFDVLDAMKSDEKLSHIPVIVVSALDEETDSVVRAIELGAEDFLPKSFDPVILEARLGASLTKKRFRDQELEYFERVQKLTEAAEVLESGRFRPQSLNLDGLAAHEDPLGRLAAVFRGMAAEIYEREMRLKRAVHTLQGALLVIGVGVVWGLTPALSRIAAGLGANPLGLAVWVNGIAATLCLGVSLYRGRVPRLRPAHLIFFLYWALIAGIMQRLTTFWVSAEVEASMLSLIITLQGFMVFAFAAATKLERATPRRLLGLTVGLCGVAVVLLFRFDGTAEGQNVFLLFAIAVPFFFATEAIYVAGRRPEHVDPVFAVGLMMALSAAMLAPVAYATGNLLTLEAAFGELQLVVLLMGVVAAASLALAFYLISSAGAVFYSQSAYAMTLAGIVWGMLLLNEQLSAVTWGAFAVILIGMYLVEPNPTDDTVSINRSFADRRPDPARR